MPGPGLERLTEQLADLVEQLRPGVVQIRTGADRGRGARPAVAGFIVDAKGIVLTAEHVLAGGDGVEVELFDGRRLAGRVIGRDARSDLAAVQIDDPGRLSALRLGDSGRVRAGELVLALGHPYGLRQAVSLGIVSWIGPPPADGPQDADFIHTDAAIGPGNSGGPLVNLAGEVIGVHSRAARNGLMGIAVPSALVKQALPRLIADGRAKGKAPAR